MLDLLSLFLALCFVRKINIETDIKLPLIQDDSYMSYSALFVDFSGLLTCFIFTCTDFVHFV